MSLTRVSTVALAGLAFALLAISVHDRAGAVSVDDRSAGILMADGAAVWGAECKKCHGDDGKGKTKMGEKLKIPDLTTKEFQGKHDKAAVVRIVTEGVADTKMKAFKDKLSAEEIDAVSDFVKKLGG